MKLLIPIVTLMLGGLTGYFLRPPLEGVQNDQRKISLETLGEASGNTFPFSEVIKQNTNVKVLRSGKEHSGILKTLQEVGQDVAETMSRPDSPAREKQRINEVSALFEESLRIRIDALSDYTCSFPKTISGEPQRSGYPDLRVEHLPTGTIAYLDPKLFEDKSIKSSFRTFYYEPGGTNSKVTEDALHLLIGFPHNGKTREWTFGTPKLVDLSDLTVKLKAEFSASNKDLYSQ